jgi:ribosomal protein L37E
LQVDIEELQNCLDGTPALGLKHHFKCHCGASGFVALHIKCTKCGRESWWGWFPRE